MKRFLITMMVLYMAWGLHAAVATSVTDSILLSEDTLPVELSSFSAVINAYNKVRLQWTTQSESNLLGYYILRADQALLADAQQISTLIQPANSSTAQYYAFEDQELQEVGEYFYWLNSVDYGGGSEFFGPVQVLLQNSGNQGVPQVLTTGFGRVYPNPFNPEGNIEYYLKDAGSVQFKVYNLKGQLLKSIEKTQTQPGRFILNFNAIDDNGQEFASGVYFIRMQAGTQQFSKKIMLMK